MSYVLIGKRAKEMYSVAEANSLPFQPEDKYLARELPTSIFAQSDANHFAQHLMTARIAEKVVKGFDFPYWPEDGASASDPTGRPARQNYPQGAPQFMYDAGFQYGCVVTDCDAALPLIHISPRKRKEMPVEVEVAVDDSRVRKMFQIWCHDVDYADAFLSPTMCDFLVSTKGKMAFGINRWWLMVVKKDAKAAEFPPLMRVMMTLLKRLPRSILDAFPRPESSYANGWADGLVLPKFAFGSKGDEARASDTFAERVASSAAEMAPPPDPPTADAAPNTVQPEEISADLGVADDAVERYLVSGEGWEELSLEQQAIVQELTADLDSDEVEFVTDSYESLPPPPDFEEYDDLDDLGESFDDDDVAVVDAREQAPPPAPAPTGSMVDQLAGLRGQRAVDRGDAAAPTADDADEAHETDGADDTPRSSRLRRSLFRGGN